MQEIAIIAYFSFDAEYPDSIVGFGKSPEIARLDYEAVLRRYQNGDIKLLPTYTNPKDYDFFHLWIKRKMYIKVHLHRRKYPAFSRADKYLSWASLLTEKQQKYEAYQPIKKWSKSNRFCEGISRLAESQD